MGLLEIIVIFLGMMGGLGLPMGMPPGEEDARMYRLAPEQTVFYASWVGLRDPDPNANPTEKWLSIKEVAKFRRKLRAALFDFGTNDWWNNQKDAPMPLVRSCARTMFEAGIRNPTAVYVRESKTASAGRMQISALAAIKLEKEFASFKKDFEQWKLAIQQNKPGYQAHKIEKVEALDLSVIKLGLTGNRNFALTNKTAYLTLVDDLAILASDKQEIELALANLKTPAPRWLAETRKNLDIKQLGSISYLDFEYALKSNQEASKGFGNVLWLPAKSLENDIKSIANVCGINELGFISRSKITLLDGKNGPSSVLGTKPLTEKELGSIDSDCVGGMAIRVSSQLVLKLLKESLSDSSFEKQFEKALAQREDFTREKIEDAFNQGIGDFVVLQSNPTLFMSNVNWRLDVSINEVMTFPSLINQMSETISEFVRDQLYGEVKKQQVGNSQFFNYKGKYAWQNLSWAVIDDRIVFGQRPPEELAKPLPAPKEKQLVTQPAMASLIEYGKEKKLGQPIGIIVLDIPNVIGGFRSYIDNLQNQDQEIIEGIDFRYTDIPPTKFWSENAPHLTTLYRVDDGIIMHQTQTVPGSNWVTTCVAAGTAIWLFELE